MTARRPRSPLSPGRSPDRAAALPLPTGPCDFAARLVAWQRAHGRHELPWQVRDPYRVWLSEIMLQQTQVQTVLGYFARFVQRFPDVHALAAAETDEVLALWSGLGYYQRARNLHRCAQIVVAEHQGQFPRSAAALAALPGIGASTAAAIAAFCFGERAAILDGNVRRVLCRAFGLKLQANGSASTRTLQPLAEALLPASADMPAYTQGLMDLGAMVCRPRQPDCGRCPFAADCIARAQGDPQSLPLRGTAGRARPQRQNVLLWLRDADSGALWLQRRPAVGVWPGLWCPPLFGDFPSALQAAALAGEVVAQRELPKLRHGFTHFELTLAPLLVEIRPTPRVGEEQGRWISRAEALALGLPAPVRKLLDAEFEAAPMPANAAAGD